MIDVSYIGDPQLLEIQNSILRKRLKKSIYQLGLSDVTVLQTPNINISKLLIILLNWNSISDTQTIRRRVNQLPPRDKDKIVSVFERVSMKNIYNMCPMYKKYEQDINIFMKQFEEKEINQLIEKLNVQVQVEYIVDGRVKVESKGDGGGRRPVAFCKIIVWQKKKGGKDSYLLCVGFEGIQRRQDKDRGEGLDLQQVNPFKSQYGSSMGSIDHEQSRQIRSQNNNQINPCLIKAIIGVLILIFILVLSQYFRKKSIKPIQNSEIASNAHEDSRNMSDKHSIPESKRSNRQSSKRSNKQTDKHQVTKSYFDYKI